MNELSIIKINQGAIVTNFKEFHAELIEKLEDYKDLIVTKDNLKEMKDTRLELTRSKKVIDGQRKAQKKEFIRPLTEFENDCKTAIETIEEAENELKQKIDVYDEEVRQEHLAFANQVADALIAEFELTEKFADRIDRIKNFGNLSITHKAITEDIDGQVKHQAKLQDNEIKNRIYVVSQLTTASKLAGLSTTLLVDDISHLIGDYETMDVASVTDGITAVAMRRKESEELAVKQAADRIREEERIKAEAKARAEQNEINRLAKEKADEEERMEFEAKRKEIVEPIVVELPDEPIDDDMDGLFNEVHDEQEDFVIFRIKCQIKDKLDILRLLAINKYDCEVVR